MSIPANEATSLVPSGIQVNRDTGKVRPILINFIPEIVGMNDIDVIPDDSSMPFEFKCPITQMPMSLPTMAADGHSYEVQFTNGSLKTTLLLRLDNH